MTRIDRTGIDAQTRARALSRLRGLGVSLPGARQALAGQTVANPADRAILADLLAGIAGGTTRAGVYDYPGDYAQRFDGVDRGGS